MAILFENKNINTLNSIILSDGIIPSNKQKNPHSSCDASLNNRVFINVISSKSGIQPAIFHECKGAFPVAIERKNDKLIENSISNIECENLKNEIEKVKKLNPFFSKFTDVVKKIAKCNYLGKDKKLIKEIAKRINRTAMIILKDLEVNKSTLGQGDGCSEQTVTSISPKQIDQIILSEREFKKYESQMKNFKNKIVWVKDKAIPGDSIELRSRELGDFKLHHTLRVPDYEGYLEKLAGQRKDLVEKPICVHVVRLKTDDECQI